MRYSYLLASLFVLSLSSVTLAQDDPPPPPPEEGADGPPPPPPPPPHQNFQFDNRRKEDGRRKPRIFQPNEQIHIAGGRDCYIRPQCNAEKAKSRHKGKLSGRRLMCAKGKPKPEQLEFVWKAQPCSSPEGKKHHFVRFENAKHKGRLLCLTRKPHKSPKRRYPVHFGILGHKKNGGCAWKVKEAMVYNRGIKKMEKRFVFVNRKHKHYTLRVRRGCKQSPPGPRRLFAAQNYLNEARVDTRGSFRIEPAGGDAGYNTE